MNFELIVMKPTAFTKKAKSEYSLRRLSMLFCDGEPTHVIVGDKRIADQHKVLDMRTRAAWNAVKDGESFVYALPSGEKGKVERLGRADTLIGVARAIYETGLLN
jgi:hypothetical protein